jgi:Mrp family chromosome partitioning ATPase
MNKQPFPLPRAVSNANQAPARQVDQDDAHAINGHTRKRFRRGVAQRFTNVDFVTKLDQPVRKSLVPTRSAYSAVIPRRVMTQVPDEWDELGFVPKRVRRHFLSGVSPITFFRRDPAARAFALLRTRLLQTMRANSWSRVAIASPTHGCGSTFMAVNLAQSLARIPGSRTVLMDVNHRTPGVAGMLDVDIAGDMRGYLRGEVPLKQHLMRTSETLALGLTSGAQVNAAEIFLDRRCGETLNHMTKALRPDVVLYDLPPILVYDDLAAFLPQVDGVLLVADGTQTTASQITACKGIIEEQSKLLGISLNRARESDLASCEA